MALSSSSNQNGSSSLPSTPLNTSFNVSLGTPLSSPSLGLTSLGIQSLRTVQPLIVPPALESLRYTVGSRKYLRCPDLPDDRNHREAYDAFMTLYRSAPYFRAAQHDNKREITFHSEKRTSEVWTHYDECISLADGTPFVICRRCSKVLAHPVPGNNGNNSLNHHRKGRHCQSSKHAALSPMKRQEKINVAILRRTKRQVPASVPTFNDDNLNVQLMRTLVACNMPWRTIEHPQFRRFCRFLNLGAHIPSRTKFKKFFVSEFFRVSSAANLFEGLEESTKISIAADCWTSRTGHGFLGIKASYIDALWQLREPLIALIPLTERHTGEELANQIEEVLSRLKVAKRLLSFVSDNASNMKSCKQELSKLLEKKHGVHWDHDEMGLPCLAHVIELCVQELLRSLTAAPTCGIENAEEETISNHRIQLAQDIRRLGDQESGLAGTLHKLRSLITYIQASPQRLSRFLRCQEPRDYSPHQKPLRLRRDVVTRWGSSHDMIITSVRLRHAIDRFLRKEGKVLERQNPRTAAQCQRILQIRFSDDEWTQLLFVQDALSVFRSISNSLGMSREPLLPTCWAVFNDIFDHLAAVRRDLRAHVSNEAAWRTDLLLALDRAETKLRKYYSVTSYIKRGLLYNVGTILDPTAKLSVYIDWKEDWAEVYLKQFQEYRARAYPDTEDTTRTPSTKPTVPTVPRSFGASIRFRRSQGRLRHLERQQSSSSEFDDYIRAPRHDEFDSTGTPFDILKAWKSLSIQYPNLGRMAKDHLSVLVTSYSLEQVFSICSNFVTPRRGQLSAESLAMQMMIKHDLIQRDPAFLGDKYEFFPGFGDPQHNPDHETPVDEEATSSEVFTFRESVSIRATIEAVDDSEADEVDRLQDLLHRRRQQRRAESEDSSVSTREPSLVGIQPPELALLDPATMLPPPKPLTRPNLKRKLPVSTFDVSDSDASPLPPRRSTRSQTPSLTTTPSRPPHTPRGLQVTVEIPSSAESIGKRLRV